MWWRCLNSLGYLYSSSSPQGQALSPRLSPSDTLLLAVGDKWKVLPFLSLHTYTFRYSAGYCTLGRKAGLGCLLLSTAFLILKWFIYHFKNHISFLWKNLFYTTYSNAAFPFPHILLETPYLWEGSMPLSSHHTAPGVLHSPTLML